MGFSLRVMVLLLLTLKDICFFPPFQIRLDSPLVYHTGQGQDERARPRPAHLLRGLDSAWSGGSNPHRESGTRWWAAADVGAGQGQRSRTAEGRRGNRWGDSVGAEALRTREGLRSAESAQRGLMQCG